VSEDAVHFRELAEQMGRLRTEVVSEVRVVGDRLDRRHDALAERIGHVEVRQAAHERAAMHDGTRDEFERQGSEFKELADQVRSLVKLVAYGSGAVAATLAAIQIGLQVFK
jgi:hypothetical protein